MRRAYLILLGVLLTWNGGPMQEVTDTCIKSAVICENLAEGASWRRKALFGMMHPDYMADVVAEMEEMKSSGGEHFAAMAFWEFENYLEALEGDFNEYASTIDYRPFAVFADGNGDGLVMYTSGFGYRVGSQFRGGHITWVTSESMAIKSDRTGEEEIIEFRGLYLAGRLVDEKGVGISSITPPSQEEMLKGWTKSN